MAFSFLKLKLKPTPAPVRPRPVTPQRPVVQVGHVGAGRASPSDDTVDEQAEASKHSIYKKLRRAASHTELRVGDAAMAWLLTLPPNVRPLNCCKAYPHVVNHLAGWWDSPDALGEYFVDLLNSPRKKRAGFPPPVKTELEALLAYARVEKLVN